MDKIVPLGMLGLWLAVMFVAEFGHLERRRDVLRSRGKREPSFLVVMSDADPDFYWSLMNSCGLLTTRDGVVKVTYHFPFFPWIKTVAFSAPKGRVSVDIQSDFIRLVHRDTGQRVSLRPQRLGLTPFGIFRMRSSEVQAVGLTLIDGLSS